MKHLVNSSSQPQSPSHGLLGLLPRLTKWGGVAVVLLSLHSAFGFALLGPFNEAWEAPVIGYNLPGDIGAPKDFNQGYRRNTPVMYYSMDANFLTYFGSNGIYAVDQAYQVFNNLTNASQMSYDLSEFALNTTRVNPTAEALFLFDLKSMVMSLMVEQLGGAEPERYIFAMHDRYLPPGGTCPINEEYLIVKRNFDPVTFLPTSYVNGTLYSYTIVEFCTGPNPLAYCLPFQVDPTADTYTPVADTALGLGRLYTGLTRDDVGVIRYLLRTNNYAVESPPTDSLAIVTNTLQGHFLLTSNLTEFAQIATTTNAVGLQGLFPGLVITGSTNWWTRYYTTNLVLLGYRNAPWDPVGTPPHIPVYQTNTFINFALRYQHTFGNLVTFQYSPTGVQTVPITMLSEAQGHAFVTLQTTTAQPAPWDPTGTLVTNITSHTYLTNAPVGDYVILPTNSCGVFTVASLYTNVYSTTNLITSTNITSLATNTVSGTGTNTVSGSTNVAVFSQSLVQYYTNHLLWVYDVDCQTNAAALRQGIDKITYVRRDMDSLLYRFFYPVTNQYTMMTVTNSLLVPQVIQRVLVFPDFLLTGQDGNNGPSGIPATGAVFRDIHFNTNDVPVNYFGNAGPGTIDPATFLGPGATFIFNTSTPVWYNQGSPASEATKTGQVVIWGSFDMSTNLPIVYPNRTSLADLENMILIQVTPYYLPNATNNVPYQVQLQTQADTPNWQAPYTWELAPNSPPMPLGLTVNPDGSITGTPLQSGTFNFVVRVTDAQGRIYNRAYPLVVN